MARGNGARKRRAARRAAARHAQRGAQTAPVRVPALVAATEGTLTRRAQRPAPGPSEATQRAAIESARYYADQFSVSGSTSLPLGPRDQTWDASAADRAVRSWADAEDAPNAKYGQAFFIKDGDGTNFGDYRLGFAQPVNGTLTANWGGITAVAGVLSGARGGVKGLSDAETAGVKSRVAGYYSKAAKKYGDESIKVPWQAAAEASVAFAEERGLDVFYASGGEPTNDQGRYVGVGGDFDPKELVSVQRAAMARALAVAEHGSDADPAVLAVATAAWEEEFAPMPECATCDHAYAEHLGTDGPCTMDGCSCDSYESPEVPSTTPSRESGAIAEAYVRIRPDVSGFEEELEAAVNSAVGNVLERWRLTFDVTEDTLPDPHKPGARVPRRRPGPRVPAAPAMSEGAQWSAIFAPEGKLTSDGRAFAPGSITWRELPLTLMAMTETSEGGHIGAEVAGKITRIWRDEAAGLIRAQGVWANTDYGREIAGLVTDQTLRGVSVDLAIQQYVSAPRSDFFDKDGNWAPKEEASQGGEPSLLDLLLGEVDQNDPIISVVLAAEIGMTTVCPFPAFAEAKIVPGDSLVASMRCDSVWTITSDAEWAVGDALVASGGLAGTSAGEASDTPPGSEGEALTASAAGLAPLKPPAAWFTHETDGPIGSVFVSDEGRVSGYVAVWDTCHLSFPGQCVEPPRSASDYAYFHLGEVECEDGSRIACGQITMDTGHAANDLGRTATLAHYDHTGTAVADVVAGEDEFGIWVAGALRPDVSAEKARVFRGSKLSGDWRGVNGKRELVAVLCVNVPGFPVPRPRALVAAAEDGSEELISLTAAGIPFLPEVDLTPLEREQFAALHAQAELAALAGS